ncbi:MAG: nucleoside monophosphate kinase [Candidatus Pelagibacter bacterium]|nr:nucleoside monophosphate kinase [Candidatus Pelagibacter bacterium]
MNIILFGPPGAGKGTQAKNIIDKFNLYQVSTGDLLRNEIKNKTEIGNKIEKIIGQGDFVTDDIVNKLLKKVITNPSFRNRIIFDGYPRNINQVENLEIILNADNQSVNFILFLKVNKDIIEKIIL